MDLSNLYKQLPNEGWLYEDEAKALWEYADKTEGPIIEVGSYAGKSAVLFGHLATKKNRVVFCVDPWDENTNSDKDGEGVFQRFLENTKGLPVKYFRQRVEDWQSIPCEFIYLDGDHTYQGTESQIKKALQCNPKFILIHDFNDDSDIKRAAIDLLGQPIERINRIAVYGIGRESQA